MGDVTAKEKYSHIIPVLVPEQNESNTWIFRTEVIAQMDEADKSVSHHLLPRGSRLLMIV